MALTMPSAKEEEPRRNDRTSLIVAITTTTISVIVAVISLWSARMPAEVFYPLAIVLLICTLAFLITVSYGPISRLFRARRVSRLQDQIAKGHRGQFMEFLDKFIELSDQTKFMSVSSDLTELHDRSGIQDFQRLFILSTHYTQELLVHFRQMLNNVFWSKEAFVTAAETFDDIVRIYNNFSVCKPVEEIRTIGREKVPEKIRENYQDHRAVYVRFLQEYQDFVKKMNKLFQQDFLRVPYYETPKEL